MYNENSQPKKDQAPRRKSSFPQTSESKQPALPGQALKEVLVS